MSEKYVTKNCIRLSFIALDFGSAGVFSTAISHRSNEQFK